jgi:hypothetical protein
VAIIASSAAGVTALGGQDDEGPLLFHGGGCTFTEPAERRAGILDNLTAWSGDVDWV